MALPVKVSMGFLRKNPENKVIDGEVIANGLEANKDNFPDMPQEPADLLKKNGELQKAKVAANTGDKTAGETLKKVEGEWINMYGETASFVSYHAAGNAELIVACGFKTTKADRKKRTHPDMLQDVKAAPGTGKGNTVVSCKAQKGNKGYITIAATPDTKVTMNGNTIEIEINGVKAYIKPFGKPKTNLQNLQSNQPLCVTMLTFNSAGSSPLGNSEEMATQ